MQDPTPVLQGKPNSAQPVTPTAISYLAEAIIHRLRGRDSAAQQLEQKAREMTVCTDFVFAEYHIELAIRLAREGRFTDADDALARARSLMGRDSEGLALVATGRTQILVWLHARLEDPVFTMAAAVPYLP